MSVEHTERTPYLTAVRYADYMKIEVPPTTYLVDGLMVEGSAILFSAREKAGKGLIMLDLAVSLASGSTFLNRPVSAGPVFYIALEENIGTIKNRLERRHPSHDDISLFILQLDGSMDNEEEFFVDDANSITGLAELIGIHQPVAVIIDTLRESHRGRENESDDMAPRLRAIRTLAHKTNTTIIVTHHVAKMTGGARGSTAIRAAFDDVMEFTRDDTNNDSVIRGVLHVEGRNLPKVLEHIAFDSDTFQWEATSPPPVVVTPNIRSKILGVLNETDDWLSKEDLTNAIPSAVLGSVQNELSRMMRERPRPFAVDVDNPVKGKPRKYHGINKADIPNHSSQTTDGTHEEMQQSLTNHEPWDGADQSVSGQFYPIY